MTLAILLGVIKFRARDMGPNKHTGLYQELLGVPGWHSQLSI